MRSLAAYQGEFTEPRRERLKRRLDHIEPVQLWRSRPWFLCPNCGGRAGKLYLTLVAVISCAGERGAWHATISPPIGFRWQRLGGDPETT